MASSRKPRPPDDPFALALDAALTRAQAARAPAVLGVAFSGGPDSTLLLGVAEGVCRARNVPLVALHVHHGLSPHADAWATHCIEWAARLDVPCLVARVDVAAQSGASVEARARRARYAALGELARQHGVTLLVTGHNLDDQIETIVFNLARGTGVAGLAGMPAARLDAGLALERPFLEFSGAAIRAALATRGWSALDDESNADTRFARNALRHEVLPRLEQIAPGARENIARLGRHALQAQQLLDERAHDDLREARLAPDALSLRVLRALSSARAGNALRLWFSEQGGLAPSTAFLEEVLAQIRAPRAPVRAAFVYLGRPYRTDGVRLFPGTASVARGCAVELLWRGEAAITVPEWRGTLTVETNQSRGLPAALLTRALELRGRSGGERLRLESNRPRRTLKNLYQERAIGVAERTHLPLLYAERQLIFAAGLGMNAELCALPHAGPRVVLGWRPAAGSDAAATDAAATDAAAGEL